jgi:5,6-dimethylbenzimidazole synthase
MRKRASSARRGARSTRKPKAVGASPGESSAPELAYHSRRSVYRAIYQRRDVRHFHPDPIPDPVLARLLDGTHQAPSVDFMQPWEFVIMADLTLRTQVKERFLAERKRAAQAFAEPRRSRYLAHKLEGILEVPLSLCVTCDPSRRESVLGRSSIPETDVYATPST